MLTEQKLEVESLANLATPPGVSGLAAPRNALFLSTFVISVIIFWTPLRSLASLSLKNDEYSHTILIPLISSALVYLERRKIFSRLQYSLGVGTLLLLAGIVLSGLGVEYSKPLHPDSYLCIRILSLVTLWIAGFIFCYGTQAFRSGAFALLFTLLMVPVPQFLMDKPIVLIQHASAEVANLLLKLSGVPFFRDGMHFSLVGLDMEVAKQCSGIHSTLALLLTSLVVGHLCLGSCWHKIILTLSVLPIISFTNGFRIFTVSFLAAYVDASILRGNLHHRGGVLFLLLGLVILTFLVRLLRSSKREMRLAERI